MSKIIIYDFDGTLTSDPMPKYNILKRCGMNGITDPKFLGLVKTKSLLDKINIYEALYRTYINILRKNNIPLNDDSFSYGADNISYNNGVEDFVEYLKNNNVHNYLISSGIKAYLEKIKISHLFEGIYATTFNYNENGEYQSIDSIMDDDKKVDAIKDILENHSIFDNNCNDVIYVGDGLTDAKAMEFVKNNGGKVIFINNNSSSKDIQSMKTKCIVDYFVDANYEPNSELCSIIKSMCNIEKSKNTNVNDELKTYIEQNVLPSYKKNDSGHDINHINNVINRSFEFAKNMDNINYDILYTTCAYHDIGHYIDAKNHEKISAKIFLSDDKMSDYFNKEEINTIFEAIEDHRASNSKEPRSIYGKIVSSADRNTSVNKVLKRSYTYSLVNSPQLSIDEIIELSRIHLSKKFGNNGYASEKMYFEDIEYNNFLKEMDVLTNDKEEFKRKYIEVNNINNTVKNILFLFNELKKSNKISSTDELLYYIYNKLYIEESFDTIKKAIMAITGINNKSYSKVLKV